MGMDPDLKTYEIHKEMALQKVMQCTEFVLSRNHSTLDYFILYDNQIQKEIV